MKKKQLFLLVASILFYTNKSFSQSMADVNMLTGSANLTIPLANISKGQISMSVSLNYATNGTRPKDIEGTAGMGWNIQAGGQVSRVVHGLPDDLVDNVNSPVLNGWMTSTGKANIDLFTPANDNNSSTCPDELSDINYINASLPYNQDTEPDDFYINAPGLSCHLVYDRATAKFQPVSYQNLVITYTTVGGTGNKASLINSFTITNDKGITYLFEAPESVYQSIAASATPTVFTTQYYQYIHGVYFYNSWNLTKMTDQSGVGLLLTYNTASVRSSTNPISLYVNGSTTASFIYSVKQTALPQVLDNITTTDAALSDGAQRIFFSWTPLNSTTQTGQTVISTINARGRVFYFYYSQARYYFATNGNYYDRDFLQNVTDQSVPDNTPFNYKFSYSGVTDPTTTLPDSSSTQIDYWGYYIANSNTSLIPKVWINPSNNAYPRYSVYYPTNGGSSYTYSTTNGNSRIGSSAGNDIGCLTQITNALGGTTTIAYESNDFLDVPSNQVIKGGGIRVRQITDYDGINTANNIVRNYSYKASPTSLSSGKPISMPVYAFTASYTGTLTGQAYWDRVTVLSDNDLSTQDHTIMYEYASMSRAGAGNTLYQYNIPATYWDASAAPVCSGCTTEWYPAVNNVARNSCTTSSWAVKNDIYSYPFIPNPNYDFERGLIRKITNYDYENFEVSETNYTYQRSFTPSVITAFRADDNFATVKSYNKYTIYFNTGELTAQVSQKVFGSPSLLSSQTTTTNYTYGGTNHKLLTKQSVTNSDNSVINTYYTYTKDYAASGSNPNVNAIYNLNLMNMNLPVETYQQVVRAGTTTTVGGSLTLYSPFTVGSVTMYKPSQQLKFVQAATPSAFTPFNVTGGVPNRDSKYFVTANFTNYSNMGFPQTIDDGNKNIITTIPDPIWNKPVATFSNANLGELGYSSFDSDIVSPGDFSITGSGTNTYSGSGHVGSGASIGTSNTISKTITRSAIADNYIFSVWINAATGVSGNITITLNGTTAGTIAYTGTGKAQYYEKKLLVTGLPSTVPVNITTSQPIVVDDILLYPDVAEVTTASYGGTLGYKTSQTNTNGISAYYTSDAWGRLTYAYDKDHNIVQKNIYVTPAQILNYNEPYFTHSTDLYGFCYVNQPITFELDLDPSVTSGVAIQWDFGDMSAAVTTALGAQPSHIYATTGTYTVTATISSPILGKKVVTDLVNVKPVPIPTLSLSYTNTTPGQADITTVTFTPTGSGTSYSFTGSQLNTASVLQGNYTIVVTLSGAKHYNGVAGYNSVSVGGTCSNWVSSNIYTYTLNLTGAASLNFNVSPNNCP